MTQGYLSKECFFRGVSPWGISVGTTVVVSTFAFYVYNAPFAQITNGILGVGTFLLATTVALGIANERSGDFKAVKVTYDSTDDTVGDTDSGLQKLRSSTDESDESSPVVEKEPVLKSRRDNESKSEDEDDKPRFVDKKQEEESGDEGDRVGFEEFVFEDREYDPPDDEVRIILLINAVILLTVMGFVLFYSLRLLIFDHQTLVIASLGAHLNGEQKVLLRCPSGTMNFQFGIEKGKPEDIVKMTVSTPKNTDYTSPIILSDLLPTTTYVADAKCGNETVHLKWKTLPKSGSPGKFSFAFGSCMLPRPLQARQSLHTVMSVNPDFFLFVGDFIYADHPQWLLPGSKQTYERHYREVFADKFFSAISHSLPSFFMYDDHEIYNNWDGTHASQISEAALETWQQYLASTNPPSVVPKGHYYSFSVADSAFFVMDTRLYRTSTTRTEKSSMLGDEQLNHLLSWLENSESYAFKFLVSPTPLTERTSDLDTWYGYNTERDKINKFITDKKIPGVLWLSGDRHWAGIFELMPDAFWSFKELGNHTDILFFSNKKRHVGYIEVDTTVSPPRIVLESFEAKTGKLLLTTTFNTAPVGLSVNTWKV